MARTKTTATAATHASERRSLVRGGIPGCSQPLPGGEAGDRGDDAQQEADGQKSLLEGAQRLRQRQSRNPVERAGLPGQGKIQNPGADREGERDDRRRCRAFGNAGRKQRNGPDQQAVEQMAEKQIGGFRRHRDARRARPRSPRPTGRGNERKQPSAEDRRHLGGDQRRHPVGQLHQQAQRAGFLFAAEASNGDERKQQGDRDVERAEGRDQNAVERREPARQHRRVAGRGARLAVERDRLPEAVADQRAKDQQHGPQRAAAHDLPQLLGEQRRAVERRERGLRQVSARKTSSNPADGIPVCARRSASVPMPRTRPSASSTKRSQTRSASIN